MLWCAAEKGAECWQHVYRESPWVAILSCGGPNTSVPLLTLSIHSDAIGLWSSHLIGLWERSGATWERKMRTNFLSTNFLSTTRSPGHPGKIPGTSQIPLSETQGRQTFEGEHEVFGHHPFAWKTQTPPGGLRTQKVNLCALFSCLMVVSVRPLLQPPKPKRIEMRQEWGAGPLRQWG